MRIKGPSLAEATHGDIGLRSAGDIDILVAREDLPRAIGRLIDDGYSEPVEGPPGESRPELHYTLSRSDRARVEVHWRVHWHEEAFSRDMLSRAQAGPDGLLEPTVADMAASLLLIHARDGFYGLRMAADLAAWYDRHLSETTGLLDSYLGTYPELARSLRAAAVAAEQVVGVPASTWLSDPGTADRRVRLATRLTNWEQRGDRAQLFANLGLVDGLLTPSGALPEFVRRELATGPEDGRPRHRVKRLSRQIAGLWVISRRPWSPIPPGSATA